jgi:hypothetical protein
MPLDPAKLTPDSRTPQELVALILQHEFSPESPDGVFKRVSFGEQLEYNAHDHVHPAARLLWPLKRLAAGQPLSPFDRIDLSHGLKVIAAYKTDSTDARDRYAMHANPDMRPTNEAQREARRGHRIHGTPTDDAQRQAADEMETSAAEIGNLKLIERLLRIVTAHPNVNVKLIEPGRAAGRD